ncbi:MAG: DUF2059 domain-containing protein [Neisseria sp.]|nr:DUF2059 domain-containing protein [Neisseria sp.]
MLKKSLTAALLAAGLMLSPLAAAQKPSEESVLRLIELQHINKQLKDMGEQVAPAIAEFVWSNMGKFPQANRLKESQMAELRELVVNHSAQLTKDMVTSPELSSGFQKFMVELYQENYTQKEIDAAVAFYETEEGQSVLKKNPQVMRQMLPWMAEFLETWKAKNMPKYQMKLRNDLNDFITRVIQSENAVGKGRLKK